MTRFLTAATIALLASAFADARPAFSQQTLASTSATRTRTEEIVASFNRNKHVVKEKYGVRREKYKVVRSVAVIRQNPQSYSGTYEVMDLGLAIRLDVDRSGNVNATGREPVAGRSGTARTFTIVNARLEGALVTGTKVYAGGGTERFEGVFINRSSFESPTDTGVTTFGLGVVGRPLHISGVSIDTFFFEKTK